MSDDGPKFKPGDEVVVFYNGEHTTGEVRSIANIDSRGVQQYIVFIPSESAQKDVWGYDINQNVSYGEDEMVRVQKINSKCTCGVKFLPEYQGKDFHSDWCDLKKGY